MVEKTITFDVLHETIQVVMGWTNSHLHEFTVQGTRIGQPLDKFDRAGGPAEFCEELIDEATVTLESVLTDDNQSLTIPTILAIVGSTPLWRKNGYLQIPL